jgi:hypothetical protein
MLLFPVVYLLALLFYPPALLVPFETKDMNLR